MKKPSSYLNQRNINLKDLGANRDSKITPTDYYMRFTENLEQKEYRLRTDDDGFIIGENNLKTEKDSVDILFFGASTLFFQFLIELFFTSLLKQNTYYAFI